ncbi:flagellar basal body rod protein FlgC [Falsirhodobacter halotolerans]|uniref:flagellar basal body rod protein FlgC n=1 Tax=Falsirhodobacter halotolerans TaxID=1146892 RepID=UPI001FD53A14|nr:flagellar basal body rod protein FlgC [Falsirhodobacter halotolerans]MCJ8140564.1 flagellar basal body rod protein FlgC [Falsirhodobacter halotolerans]
MSDLFSSLAISATGMTAQSQRLRHVSENIANADTPGYHRKTVSFAEAVDGGVTPERVRLDRSELTRIYDPAHPMADASGHYDGSNVDLVIEVADAREAQRSYEANLRLFDQARQMTQSLFELLRR